MVVDDGPLNVDLLEQELKHLGYRTAGATSGEDALAVLVRGHQASAFPGAVVTDVKMPDMDGLQLMRRVFALDPELPVILVTAHGDISMAVEAMRDGAYDFIEKPFERQRLSECLRRAVEKRRLVLQVRALRDQVGSAVGLEAIIVGKSSTVAQLRAAIANLADTSANVLVHGETGTGKELVARCLHDFSARRQRHFVPVNCGAIPREIFESELFGHEPGAFTGATKRRVGKLEHASGGTIFLDEIESMPLDLQIKLLRVLEERVIERLGSNERIAVDFRIVAATKTDLKNAADYGDFRDDLYYRVAVAELYVPPLRDRPEDVALLFESFRQQLAAYHDRDAPEPSGEDFAALLTYGWPGNIRELKNAAERYVLGLHQMTGGIGGLVNPEQGTGLSLAERVNAFERSVIERALAENKGNIQATVEGLGAPRRTLNEKMRKYGLDRKGFM